ncbi:hypothetical protein SAMN05192569_1001354 [Parageobacillus thermantarcticus]|uniref:Uncharacterized protein n=1 Tax=Parageobacillus thermantarcticus TaxID=186116 RepID=A0A1I0SJG5_9BACL|nr:hypothetical protein SAMN05192569_1001354 [Parageobacillus thermantarcticus]
MIERMFNDITQLFQHLYRLYQRLLLNGKRQAKAGGRKAAPIYA